ncbi:Hypothetical predicted protein [Octopus vulgaris]|uniref:Uncharacterized protein n=1 Tax=Octopus vulgaris TaxID=6645 RepID=A0AA36FBF1_OCTVU|nr:Hypothetical predicted protein [Octopus vulgaris]
MKEDKKMGEEGNKEGKVEKEKRKKEKSNERARRSGKEEENEGRGLNPRLNGRSKYQDLKLNTQHTPALL